MPRKRKTAEQPNGQDTNTETQDMTGHNMLGIDPNAFHKHVAVISAAESEVALAKEKLKKARKQAKADGITLKLFDRSRQLAEMTREEQQGEMAHLQQYLIWMRSPIGTQFELKFQPGGEAFDEDEDGANARTVADAGASGFQAGLEAKIWEDDCPFEASSPAGQAWLKGYREGQEKNVAALKENARPVTGAD